MNDHMVNQYSEKYESKFAMRPSRVLSRIRGGGVARVLKMNSSDPRMTEVFALSGPDAIWLDMEHVPTNPERLEDQVRAAKLHNVDTIMRVARGSYSDYIRGFEMDAAGLMVPHTMSYEDAVSIRDMTKFPPLGRRAVDGGNADGAYCRLPLPVYLESANRERFVILQIEDPQVLPDLDRICELEGVDGLLFGAGDFSVAIGRPGQMDDPEVARIRQLIAKTARRHGKIAGAVCSPQCIGDYVDMGYNLLNVGADVIGLARYADDLLDAFNQICSD